MKIRRIRDDDSQLINLTSFTDIMFILIIFLLATTTFKEEERDVQVNLPADSKAEALSQADKVIVINVRKNGTYIVLDRQCTLEEMVKIVEDSVKKNAGQKVLVRADQEALHGYVARAVAMCKHAGVNEANIGYQLPK